MTSPFSTLLIALQQRIKSQIPDIRWIDQDLGQLENYGDRPAVSFPCVLIDFQNFQYEDASDLIQFAEGTVNIRLAFAPFSNTNNLTSVDYQAKALKFYDLEWAIYKALHGWKPDGYGYLSRVGANTENRNDSFRVRVINFSISFEDYEAQPVHTLGTLPSSLEEDIELT